MASADIEVSLKPTTIESDTDEAEIKTGMISGGVIAHHDGSTVSLAFNQDVQTAGGAGVGNVDGQLEMEPGDSVRIPMGTEFLKHKTGAGEATLWFIPDKTNPAQI